MNPIGMLIVCCKLDYNKNRTEQQNEMSAPVVRIKTRITELTLGLYA